MTSVSEHDTGSALIVLLLAAVALFVYLLPATIARARGHANRGAITALNILLGWTLICWVGALVWALTGPARSKLNRRRIRAGA